MGIIFALLADVTERAQVEYMAQSRASRAPCYDNDNARAHQGRPVGTILAVKQHTAVAHGFVTSL